MLALIEVLVLALGFAGFGIVIAAVAGLLAAALSFAFGDASDDDC